MFSKRPARKDRTQKLTEYNLVLSQTGRTHGHIFVAQEDDDDVALRGPLRIYWGIENPIQLKLFDEHLTKPTQQNTWRHSCFPSPKDVSKSNLPRKPHILVGLTSIDETKASVAQLRPMDDSVTCLSAVDTSGVILRKNQAVRKSNTVAYRGDTGNRWKRASINGHVYNNDTRVFIPVTGSCTSVMATDKMISSDVIKALLDKFKVENKAEEFSLYIVPDKGEERLLLTSDIPLLERLDLGPDEAAGKLFLREKGIPLTPHEAWSTLKSSSQDSDESSGEIYETPVEKYIEHLPEEVEQLLNLPEAVLQGLFKKFVKDEEICVKRIRRKYDRIKKMMMALLSKKESFV